MDATENNINELKRPTDSALILCSDGTTMAVRTAGLSPRIADMLCMQMVKEPVFAEILTQALHKYFLRGIGLY